MNLLSIFCFINGFINLSIGFFLLNLNKNKIINIYFFLFTLSIAVWNEGYAFMYSHPDLSTALLMANIGTIGIIFIPFFANLFVQKFLGLEERKLNAILTIIALFLLFLLLKFGFYSGVTNRGFWNYPVAGNLDFLNILFYVVIFTKINYQLFSAYIRASGIYKKRIFHLLFAFGLGFFGFVDWIPNFIYWFPPFAFLLSFTWVVVIAYATFSVRLMDTEIVIRKGVLYSITLFLISFLYLFSIYSARYLSHIFSVEQQIWFILPAVIIASILLNPIRERMINYVDKTFFKTRYEADKIAHKFSENIKRLMKVKELSEYVDRAAMRTFKLKGVCVFVFNEKSNEYFCQDARGDMKEFVNKTINPDSLLAKELKRTKKVLTTENLKILMREKTTDDEHFKMANDLICELDNLKAVITVPSISYKKDYSLIAFLLSSGKKSEDLFSETDISLLENISNLVSIALENAELFEEQMDILTKSMKLEKLAELGRATSELAKQSEKAFAYIEWFANEFPNKKEDREFLLKEGKKLEIETEKFKLFMLGILNFSRPSPLKIVSLNVKKVLDEVIFMLFGGYDEKDNQKISLAINCPDYLNVLGDQNALKQVFFNIIKNAIESFKKDFGKIEINVFEQGNNIIIQVKDDGEGIDDKIKDRIFEPFFSTKEDGIGLGLSIVLRLVKDMHGLIDFETKKNFGSIFTITLPKTNSSN